MLKTPFILLTFICWGAFSQTVLEVHVNSCATNEANENLSLCLLYEIKGQEVNQIAVYRPIGQSHFFIDKLKPGNYKLLFPNQDSINLGEQFFELKRNDTTAITLCLERYKNEIENHTSVIHELKNGESYSIFYESRGCFQFIQDSLQVINNQEKLQLIYHQKTYDLTTTKIAAIEDFEFYLNRLNPNYSCTTTDYYQVSFKGNVRQFIDGECSWWGWNKLIGELELN